MPRRDPRLDATRRDPRLIRLVRAQARVDRTYAALLDAQEERRQAIAAARTPDDRHGEPYALSAVAEVLGISRGRVNQLQHSQKTYATKRVAKRERRRQDRLAAAA